MKKILLFTLIILSANYTFAQKWTLSQKFSSGVLVEDIEPIGTQVLAATLDGIYRTGDAGNTWTKVSAFVATDISCYDKDNCFACGDNGMVMKTSDGGVNWSAVATTPTTKKINIIKAVSATEVIGAIGGSTTTPYTLYNKYYTDTLLVTNDGGTTWRKYRIATSLGAQNPLTYIYDSTLIFNSKGSDYEFYRTEDLGKTSSKAISHWFVRDLDMLDKTTGYAITWNPMEPDVYTYIFKTTDGGKTWQKQFETSNTYLWIKNYSDDPGAIDFVNDSTGWICGQFIGGRDIHKTTNSGKSWAHDTLGMGKAFEDSATSARFFRLRMLTPTYGWLSYGNRILKYGDSATAPPNAINKVSKAELMVYPNPSADGIFHIVWNENNPPLTITVMDITGKIITATNTTTLDLSKEKQGMYIVVAETITGQYLYKKISKE